VKCCAWAPVRALGSAVSGRACFADYVRARELKLGERDGWLVRCAGTDVQIFSGPFGVFTGVLMDGCFASFCDTRYGPLSWSLGP
jgi:hypothetical protein